MEKSQLQIFVPVFIFVFFSLPAKSSERIGNIPDTVSQQTGNAVNLEADPAPGSFIYISFAGRKYFPEALKSSYLIEAYHLPLEQYRELKKLTAGLPKHGRKNQVRIDRLLYPFRDSLKEYSIRYQPKYKQFYPKGLRTGDFIAEKEFQRWDFTGPFMLEPRVNGIHKVADERSYERYFDSISEIRHKKQAAHTDNAWKQDEYCRPWAERGEAQYRMPVTVSTEKEIDSLFRILGHFSPYLGAQRIRFELFEEPLLASFYASMYVHYVDSITRIMKDSLKIKPAETERFIQEISAVIPERFRYDANSLLWEGIQKNQFDCDNTAYLVYDVGKKLGIEVFVVFVRCHAFVVLGEFVYETTCRDYFSKENLKHIYPEILMISSDPEVINGSLGCYEIGNYLISCGEYEKAQAFITIGLKYSPDNPYLLWAMGGAFYAQDDYVNAYLYLFLARKRLSTDLALEIALNLTKEKLVDQGKANVVLAISTKYK